MSNRLLIVLTVVLAVLLVLSGLAPFDRATWWMEVAPIFIVVPVLAATRRRAPLTPLL